MPLLDVVAIVPQPPPGIIPELPHAWTSPYLAVIDTYRVLLILCDLYMIYLLCFSIFLLPTKMQKALTFSFACSVLVGMWTQVERIGASPSWRLIFITVGTVAGLWGAYKYITIGTPKDQRRWWWMFKPPIMEPPRMRRPPPTGASVREDIP
jgi:hypothetical protein